MIKSWWPAKYKKVLKVNSITDRMFLANQKTNYMYVAQRYMYSALLKGTTAHYQDELQSFLPFPTQVLERNAMQKTG